MRHRHLDYSSGIAAPTWLFQATSGHLIRQKYEFGNTVIEIRWLENPGTWEALA